jgi:hypothetical protein
VVEGDHLEVEALVAVEVVEADVMAVVEGNTKCTCYHVFMIE